MSALYILGWLAAAFVLSIPLEKYLHNRFRNW